MQVLQSVRATTWRAGRAAWWTTLFLLLILFVLLLFPGVDSLQLLFKIVLSLPCWLLETRLDSLRGSLLHVFIVRRHPSFTHFLLISDFLFFLILLVLLALFILFLFLLLILIAIVRVWTFLFLLIFLILLLFLELGSLFIAFIIRFFLWLLIFFLFALLFIDLDLFCFTILAADFIFIELRVFEWNTLKLCLVCSEMQFALLVWSHSFIAFFFQSLNQCIRVEVHDLLVGSGLVIFSFSEIIHYGGSWFFVHANSLLQHVQSPRN